MRRFASIDIGSNTLLLLITEEREGELVSIVSECDFGQLGQGLASSKTLHPEALSRSLAIVEKYRGILDATSVDAIGCVATQALREAEDRDLFLEPAEKILGVKIELISGEREASLVAQAVIQSFAELCANTVVIVDVGGASTECILVQQGEITWVKSIPIGALKMREAYLESDPPTDEETQRLYKAIDEAIDALDLPQGILVVGTAGTATSIASMSLQLATYEPEAIHGLQLSADQVENCLTGLLHKTLCEKRSVLGLEAKRADTIAAGVAIYSRVLEKCASSGFVVCDRGIRWGLTYELAKA